MSEGDSIRSIRVRFHRESAADRRELLRIQNDPHMTSEGKAAQLYQRRQAIRARHDEAVKKAAPHVEEARGEWLHWDPRAIARAEARKDPPRADGLVGQASRYTPHQLRAYAAETGAGKDRFDLYAIQKAAAVMAGDGRLTASEAEEITSLAAGSLAALHAARLGDLAVAQHEFLTLELLDGDEVASLNGFPDASRLFEVGNRAMYVEDAEGGRVYVSPATLAEAYTKSGLSNMERPSDPVDAFEAFA